MSTILLLFLHSSTVHAADASSPPQPEVRIDREAFIARSLATHPSAAAARTLRDAAGAAVVDGPLAPIMVEGGLAPLSLAGMPGAELSASWTLPTWGMRRLAREAAAGQAAMADGQERMTSVELSARASAAVDEWIVARDVGALLDRHLALLVEAEAAVARRVEKGLLPVDALAMARMARLEVEEQRIAAARRRADAVATLRAFVVDKDFDPHSFADDPGPVFAAPAPPSVAPSAPDHPAVSMAWAEADMAHAMTTMAERAARPMIDVMASYSSMWEDPMMGAMVGVGVAVPLDRRNLDAQATAARLREEAAGTRIAAARLAAELDAERARSMLVEATDMRRLMVDSMLPVAQERARLAQSAWEAGRGSLQDWLLAERAVAATSLRAAEAEAEVHVAEAMLCMAVGKLTPCASP